ncbi:hypothetical protein EI94DRAFT_1721043 [Lactarius quietus]|nr:hypothetical protein EI94DRAFT_1721043 [Lactarius quietus]
MTDSTGTYLPLQTHDNKSMFLEHAWNIGRAYRNQAMELISICQLLSRIAPLKLAHEDAELKRILRLCDLALRSAADSGTKVTDKTNIRFEKATQILSGHFKRNHRSDLPLSVYSKMEIAKWKDSVQRDGSYVTSDEWRRMITINFILLRSPLLAPDDPENVIVSQELSASLCLPEILWNFSRYEGRARVTLEQNPHFYLRCPADENAYSATFQRYPLQGLSGALEDNGTVYVLFDRPGRVFLTNGHNPGIYGNVWLLNGSLIFRDRSGVLEGEQLVRSPEMRYNLWYCEEPIVHQDSEPRSRLNRRCLPPIVTIPTDCSAEGTFEDWTILSRPTSHYVDIHVHGSRATSRLDVAPPPPTSQRPGYLVLYTTINMLDDDILLRIFDYYRLDDGNAWNVRIGWRKLSHVCQRWRHLIYESTLHLGMHILCTKGTSIVDMPEHLPPLPIFIKYRYKIVTVRGKDELGMYHALQMRDRVRCIDLHLPPSNLHKCLMLMNGPFQTLEDLSLSFTVDKTTTFTLPKTFQAPNLLRLTLRGVCLPKRLRLLSSTFSLVTLVLWNIRGASGYFVPRLLVARLQSLSQLKKLSIGFSIPVPRPSAEGEPFSRQGTPLTLPNLEVLKFKGVSAYLECLVAQIRTPLLKRLIITLFNQIIFTLPRLSHFANVTETIKPDTAEVRFDRNKVSINMANSTRLDGEDDDDDDGDNQHFSLQVMSKQLEWQIDCAAQICSALMPVVSGVQTVTLNFHEKAIPTEWENGEIDGTTWHELLRSFIRTKELRICDALSKELSRVLQMDEIVSDPGMLPDLQLLVCRSVEHPPARLFSSFIRARRVAGRPVHSRATVRTATLARV